MPDNKPANTPRVPPLDSPDYEVCRVCCGTGYSYGIRCPQCEGNGFTRKAKS